MFKKAMSAGRRGFTLIELLVVIAVIAVLATAVLSSINPVEQLNKAKDTSSKSDASEYLNAVERFYTTFGCYPWDYTTATSSCASTLTQFNTGSSAPIYSATAKAPILDKLIAQNELKTQFSTRVSSQTTADGAGVVNVLQVSSSTPADANGYLVHVCFRPSSKTFTSQAKSDVLGAVGTTHICVP